MSDERRPDPPDTPSVLSRGQRLGRYVIEEPIGRGGMGEVYLGKDERLDRRVVLKTLRPRSALHPESRRRFQREAHALSQLSHPAIATIFDFQHLDGLDILVMEYIEGQTLAARIRSGTLEAEELLNVAIQVGTALEEAHRHGILHRDLSPANVMITDGGVVKVLDFGLAKWMPEPASEDSPTQTQWATQHLAGTVPYIAPERLRGRSADERSDLYALGAILYEMATRERVFHGDTAAELIAATLDLDPVPVTEKRHDLDAAIPPCIAKALEKNPASRYQTAHELVSDLRGAQLRLRDRTRRRRVPWTLLWGLIFSVSIVGLIKFAEHRAARFPEATAMSALVTGPQWENPCRLSPDGTWFSFVVDEGENSRLVRRSVKGSENQVLLQTEADILDHDWSPQGDRICYVRQSSEGMLLQLTAAFGGGVERSILLPEQVDTLVSVRWTAGGVYVDAGFGGLWSCDLESGDWSQALPAQMAEGYRVEFDVSRDGAQCVYTVRERRRFAIWTTDLSTQVDRRLTRHAFSDIRPHWLGDENRFVVHTSNRSGQADLWVTDLQGRSQRVTFGTSVEYASSSSADGSLLGFSQEIHRSDLWILDEARDGSSATPLTGDTLEDLWPTASVASGVVAFQRRARSIDEFDPAFQSEILVAQLSGDRLEHPRVVAPRGGMPLVSPDGQWLAYYRPGRGTDRQLTLLDLQSDHSETIDGRLPAPMFDANPFRPLWTDLSWSRDGSRLFFVTEDSGQVRLRSVDTDATRKVSNWASVSHGWLRQPVFGEADDQIVYVLERPVKDDTGPTPSQLRAELHLLDLSHGSDRVIHTETNDDQSLLLPLGQRPDGSWLIARCRPTAASAPHTEFLAVGGGESVVLADLAGAVGSCRWVREQDRVVLTWAPEASGVQNLYSLDLLDSRLEAITANESQQYTLSQPVVLSEGRILYTRHEQNNDLWLIRFAP